MRHLSPTELLDAVEVAPPAKARLHLESCAECREEVAELRRVLVATRHVDIPEPSPMFWDRLSDRVRIAIAAEPEAPRRDSRWLQWPTLVPLAGLAVLVLALVATVADRSDTEREGVSVTIDAAPDSVWTLMAELVGPLDVETAQEAGIAASPGAADEFVLQLTATEREELVRLLRQELEHPGG